MVKLMITFFMGLFSISAWPQQLKAVRTTAEITLDGKLTEEAWYEAAVLDGFIQAYPKIGAEPTERTEVRVLYNDAYLFVAINAIDSFPSKVIATGLERDIYYGSDDNICLTLDTYNDKRQAILFSSNVLSARFDEEVIDNGNAFNASYNTFWNVRSSRTDTGYSMEFQIPFSSLRFEASNEVVMGIKVLRLIKHKNEYDIFPVSDVTVANAPWRVNNAAEIVFSNLKARKPFYLIPYAKANYSETRIWNSDEGKTVRTKELIQRNHFSDRTTFDRVISNMGLDIKYGISKNFTLDITTNTDFAQAETDDRILNFTRFAINLPEKRNFFLESKDYLSYSTGSGMLLFNSRSIGIEKSTMVPIIGGVRLTGKSNGFQVGLLDIQTHGINSLNIDPQHTSVLRLRKDVWGNGSFIGAFVSNRVSIRGDRFNDQTVAFDLVKRFKDNQWVAYGNVGATFNNERSGFTNESAMANVMLTRVAALGFNHSTSVEYSGRNFRPQVGFAPDSAYVLSGISNGYIWKWKKSNKRNLYWLTNTLSHKYRTINSTHEYASAELELGSDYKTGETFRITPFIAREYLPYTWSFRKDITIPMAYYRYSGIRIRYDSRFTGRLFYYITGQHTGFYGGNRSNVTLNGYYAINKNFRLTFKYDFNSFRFPGNYSASDSPGFQSHLVAGGFTFTQSIYFSVKALVQYDDISKTVGGNFRLRYNPKEGTDLYIVYNPRLNTYFGENRISIIDQQTLIVKFSKAISL